jgi:hypothetical protein
MKCTPVFGGWCVSRTLQIGKKTKRGLVRRYKNPNVRLPELRILTMLVQRPTASIHSYRAENGQTLSE